MEGMFNVRFHLAAPSTHTPELSHTRAQRNLLIRTSLCVPHFRATRLPLSDAPFGLGSVRRALAS